MNDNYEDLIARFFPKGEVRGKRLDKCLDIYFSGAIDLSYAKQVQDLMPELIGHAETMSHIILDLANVHYISSTGVGALSSALILARKRGLTLLLRGLQPKVRSVFVLLGLMQFFEEAKICEQGN